MSASGAKQTSLAKLHEGRESSCSSGEQGCERDASDHDNRDGRGRLARLHSDCTLLSEQNQLVQIGELLLKLWRCMFRPRHSSSEWQTPGELHPRTRHGQP